MKKTALMEAIFQIKIKDVVLNQSIHLTQIKKNKLSYKFHYCKF